MLAIQAAQPPMLKTRILTALILVSVFVFALYFFPDWAWCLLIAAVVWVATGEWAKLVSVGLLGRHIFGALTVAPIVAFGFVPADPVLVTAAYAAAIALWCCSIPVFLRYQVRLDGAYTRFVYGFLIFSRENTSPGLISISFCNSTSGTKNSPASFTDEIL
jgi:phosphatidate cytidylyltransferase